MFRQLKCNYISYMFAVIKVIKMYLIYPVAKLRCVTFALANKLGSSQVMK